MTATAQDPPPNRTARRPGRRTTPRLPGPPQRRRPHKARQDEDRHRFGRRRVVGEQKAADGGRAEGAAEELGAHKVAAERGVEEDRDQSRGPDRTELPPER